jgi:hypothetical protein
MFLRVLLLIVVFLGCVGGSKVESNKSAVFLEVKFAGGKRMSNEVRSVYFYEDGNVEKIVGKYYKSKKLSAKQLQEVKSEIELLDFDLVSKEKYTGVCPSVRDKPVMVYLFQLEGGKKVFSECGNDLSEFYLFELVETLISDFEQEEL